MSYFVPTSQLDGKGVTALDVPLVLFGGQFRPLLPDHLREHDAPRIVIFKKDEDTKAKFPGAEGFPYSSLMVNPGLLDQMLRFFGPVALVTLVGQYNSNNPAERKKAADQLGISPEPKAANDKKLDKEEAPAPSLSSSDDDGDDDEVSSPNSLALAPVVAAPTLTMREGWLTLAVAASRATYVAGRKGLTASLKALSAANLAETKPSPQPGVSHPYADILAS